MLAFFRRKRKGLLGDGATAKYLVYAIEEATLALAQLTPVKFNYKLQKEEEYIGFIAEDVPELVATENRKGLSPMDIVAVLTRVVQKQQSEIADLKVKISEVNNLKREMAQLKSFLNAHIFQTP